MAIEKSIYSAPMGLDEEVEMIEPMASEIDVEIIEDVLAPEEMPMEELEDGSVEITLGIGIEENVEGPFDANLVEYLDENALTSLSEELSSQVDADVASRKDWADTFVKGLEVLGFKYEERTEPWEDACGVYSTILAEAAIRFQAETMSETFPAAGPVKVKILGKESKEKEEAAQRVKADMNYELTERMVEYRPEHERLLYSLGLAGSAFKKVYFDPNIGRQTARLKMWWCLMAQAILNLLSALRTSCVKLKTRFASYRTVGFMQMLSLANRVHSTPILRRKRPKKVGTS